MEKAAGTLRDKLSKKGPGGFLVEVCTDISCKQGQSERVFCLSPQKLEIYDSQCKKTATLSWNCLVRAEFLLNCINLSFGDSQVSFNSARLDLIQKKIIEIAPTMLSNIELHTNSMPAFSKINSCPNLVSIKNRINNKASELELGDISETLERFEQMYLFRESKVVFSTFNNPKTAMLLLLDVIPLCNFITSIVVSESNDADALQLLADFALKNTYVEYIRIEGQITPKFSNFLLAIEANKTAKIGGLMFGNSNLSSSDLKLLANCLHSKDIHSVGFKKSLHEKTICDFNSCFLHGQISGKLKKLCIDNTPTIDPLSITQKLSSLIVISLTNCNLEITKVFPVLSSLKALKTINLSGNKCSSSFFAARIKQLPNLLTNLQLSNVVWKDNSLSLFILFLSMYCHSSLCLDLSKCDSTIEDWMSFFLDLRKCNFSNLVEFRWENNPVHPKLFTFLSKNKKIQLLSFSGCFSELEPNPIISLCSFLTTCTSLKKLIIRSNEVAYIGKYAISILTAIQINQTLEYLDITNSKCGDAGVGLIKQLLENTSLRTIHCDGCLPSSCSLYSELIGAASKQFKSNNLKFSWPENDMLHLLTYYKLRHSKLSSLKESLIDQNNLLYHFDSTFDFIELVNSVYTNEMEPINTTRNVLKLETSCSYNANTSSFPEKSALPKIPKISETSTNDPKHRKRRKTMKRQRLSTETLDLFQSLSNDTQDNKSFDLTTMTTIGENTKKRKKKKNKKPSSDSDDFIFGTDVLEGKSIHSVLSPRIEHLSKPIDAEVAPIPEFSKKQPNTPDWSFPIEPLDYTNERVWKTVDEKYCLEISANNLKHTPLQKHPKI